jgi:hypothetical protein
MAPRRRERPPNIYEQTLDSEDSSSFGFVLPLPNAVFQAIGHVLCQWAYLEQRLNEDLQALLHKASWPVDPDIMSRTFRRRLAQWERIAKVEYRPDTKRGGIARFCKEARTLKETRDFLSHGTWGVGMNEITLTTYKYGEMHKMVDHDMDAKSLEEVARHISALNAEHWRMRDAWATRMDFSLPPVEPPDRQP